MYSTLGEHVHDKDALLRQQLIFGEQCNETRVKTALSAPKTKAKGMKYSKAKRPQGSVLAALDKTPTVPASL